ncbi:MAG: hypothetical protein F7B17_04995 [Desulfurococcales archaeon]|nr:hypothetical protein [Desulfurococcales archaeon]
MRVRRTYSLPREFTVVVVRGPLIELEGWRSIAESDVLLPAGFLESPGDFSDRFMVVFMKARSEGLLGRAMKIMGYSFTLATPLAVLCLALYAITGGEGGCGNLLSLALGAISTFSFIFSLATREVVPKFIYRSMESRALAEVLARETWKATMSGPHSTVVNETVYRLEVERGKGYVRVVWRRVGW